MRRLLNLFRRPRMERQLDSELGFHLDCRARDYIAAGMTESRARAQARLDFGAIEHIKDECRDERQLAWLDDLGRDLAYAMRSFRLNPGFTTVAVLTLALAIGANTAIFSVVNGVLLRELPYREADRLMLLDRTNIPTLEEWRTESRTFENIAFYTSEHVTLADPHAGSLDPEMIWFSWVSPEFLPVLGVAPVLGRGFTSQEVERGEPVAVISHELWRRRFAASPEVLGRPVSMGGMQFQVIGVMPAGFQFPTRDTDLFLPFGAHGRWQALRADRRGSGVLAIGRLHQGSTVSAAQAEMTALAARSGKTAQVLPLEVAVLGTTVPFMLMVLLGAVGFVLLIACTNVANLLLARGRAREREIAVRTALGAGRSRLIRQMIAESVLLACIAGSLGLALAMWGSGAIRRFAPQDLPRLNEIGIDARVLAFTISISVLAGLLFGLLPALKISTGRIGGLTVHGQTMAARGRSRGALVVVEFALAVMLLTGAGLMIRSFVAVLAVDPGFRPQGVLTARVSLRTPSLYAELLNRVRGLPGVEAAGAINGVMFLDGRVDPDKSTVWTVTAGDAFQTLGLPLLKGRFFSERDSQMDSPPVAIVNETFARRFLQGGEAVGKTYPSATSAGPFTIVGVLKDIRNTGLETRPVAQVFLPPGPRQKAPGELVIRAREPKQVAESLRGVLREVDRSAVLWNIATLEQRLDAQVSQRRFQTWLLGLFAFLALALAGVGIYGLLHYSVAQRTREIGIRMALGANPVNVRRMIVREGLLLALAGIVLGLAGSFALTRSIASLLFGVTPTDPATFAAVALVLTVIALCACYVPARRATRVDPLIALRCE